MNCKLTINTLIIQNFEILSKIVCTRSILSDSTRRITKIKRRRIASHIF